MSATDTTIVGRKLPRMRSVSFHGGYEVAVTWNEMTRDGSTETVDLAPLIFRLKFYAPLRDNRDLLTSVHPINGGSALAWGEADDIDMAASSVLRLAEEVMTAADFSAFMKRHRFTFDRAAAELGISKRLAGYYAAGRPVPRAIAMACELIDFKAKAADEAPASRAHARLSDVRIEAAS